MSARIETDLDRKTPTANGDESIESTRVDPRHRSASESVDESAVPASVASVRATDDVHTLVGARPSPAELDDERGQLDAHAQQLGRELDARQVELDVREGELNRRLAEFDQEMRTSRLWLEERRREIEEREVEIGAGRADLETRLERIVASERELQAARRAKRDRPAEESAEIDGQGMDVPESAFEPLANDSGPSVGVDDIAGDRGVRLRRLDEAEALLAADQQALAESRQRLEADRAAAKEIERFERGAWAEERSRQEDALRRRHESLRQRAAQLDARAESLERLRGDLAVGQRETLELRVAVQELWLQLSGRVAPAAMLQSLAEARAKLSEHYRGAEGDFDALEKRLRKAAEQLEERIANLKEHRRQFQSRADERQAAIERQAARLVAREQELETQDRRFRNQERAWNEQRLAYRRQIRRLLADLRASERYDAASASG